MPKAFFLTTDCDATANSGSGVAYVHHHALPSTQMFYFAPNKPAGTPAMYYPPARPSILNAANPVVALSSMTNGVCAPCGGTGCVLPPGNVIDVSYYVLRDTANAAGWTTRGEYPALRPFWFR